MREKNKIILLTHGGWGESLIKSMGMLVGNVTNVIDISLEPSDTLESFINKVMDLSKKIDENTLVLTDIPGGTTSNVALKLTQKYPWKIISGVNSLMLIDAIMKQNLDLNDDILQSICNSGKDSQKILKVKLVKK